MSTSPKSPATPSPSAPATVPPPVPPADAPVTAEQVEQAIREGSVEQIDRLMSETAAHGARVRANPPVPAAPARAAPPAEAPAAPPAAASPDAVEVVEEAGRPPQYQIRGRDEKETQFLALVKSGKTVPEATAAAYGQTPPAAA